MKKSIFLLVLLLGLGMGARAQYMSYLPNTDIHIGLFAGMQWAPQTDAGDVARNAFAPQAGLQISLFSYVGEITSIDYGFQMSYNSVGYKLDEVSVPSYSYVQMGLFLSFLFDLNDNLSIGPAFSDRMHGYFAYNLWAAGVKGLYRLNDKFYLQANLDWNQYLNSTPGFTLHNYPNLNTNALPYVSLNIGIGVAF